MYIIMNNAKKFALSKYPVKLLKRDKPIDVNAPRRNMVERIYREVEEEILSKATQWFRDHINIDQKVETAENGEPMADSYIAYAKARLEEADRIAEEFKNYIKEG